MVEGIVWLGHDSFRITGDGKTVYVDPWHLAPNAPAADLILVTHDHYDHLSKGDIEALRKADTVVVGPAEVTKALAGETRTISPGERLTVHGVTVTAVPAYNVNKFREPGQVFHPKADGKVGYIVEIGGRRIYHAGDTDLIPEMDDIDVDVALLPVSGTYVMTADEAAEACTHLKAAVAVPMHYGTIVGSLDDARRFQQRCPLPVEILPQSDGAKESR
jgi:L-ascorbate metabolism protein UlaG (beta-lactamase superfamily)